MPSTVSTTEKKVKKRTLGHDDVSSFVARVVVVNSPEVWHTHVVSSMQKLNYYVYQ